MDKVSGQDQHKRWRRTQMDSIKKWTKQKADQPQAFQRNPDVLRSTRSQRGIREFPLDVSQDTPQLNISLNVQQFVNDINKSIKD